jgi:hypothetical protein
MQRVLGRALRSGRMGFKRRFSIRTSAGCILLKQMLEHITYFINIVLNIANYQGGSRQSSAA